MCRFNLGKFIIPVCQPPVDGFESAVNTLVAIELP